MQQPYFFNPGLSTEQLEDWLSQQKLYLAHFNRITKEKAALEERLQEVNEQINQMAVTGAEGKLSFPWDPSPLVESHQRDSDQSVA
ncbi:TPA: hypothetical protein L7572_005581 [Klebsiella variicola]|nr:hypothetical protein [Klebsiella variicola]HBQ5645420.1 hypothetical protein [Klebsiella variicola]